EEEKKIPDRDEQVWRVSLEPVPPELDEIVLRALSKDKTKRFATARELSEEVQLFLEGEKERQRNHEQAMAKVAAGKTLVEKRKNLRAELKAAESEREAVEKEVMSYWPIEKKKRLWALHDRIQTHRQQTLDLFTEAEVTFQSALEFERGNEKARAALADLYWNRFQREEEADREAEMRKYERLVRQYNDGQYDARLKGDGTLNISTRRFPCRCLTEGRRVEPDELVIRGYHAISGRSLDGYEGAIGLPELEPKEVMHLKVHGLECKTEALEGADVWLFRYEHQNKTRVPVFPENVDPQGGSRQEVPGEVLNACFGHDSPYRPAEGLYLGKTPKNDIVIPMGSYLLLLYKEGLHPVRQPLRIGRLEEETLEITLYGQREIPGGFVQIPAGRFIYAGDMTTAHSPPKMFKDFEDGFVGRFPITCDAYLEFINDLAEKDPDQAALRAPRKAPTTRSYWPRDEEGRYHIPTEKWISDAPEIQKERAQKLDNSPIWWDEDWPVLGVSWEDLITYAAWRTRREDRLFSLPHELLWEKSARGVDGRFFPWGDEIDPTFCNINLSHEEGMRPVPVRSFPKDESPYGVRGLSGNARDQSLSDPGEAYPDWRVQRGGSWSNAGYEVRCAHRTGTMISNVSFAASGRLVWLPVCMIPV
ncbi:MAG: SUMF1/EgtB/PvdO family nonheme iron enzyme, partial [Planctomycetota bacterium]